MLLETPFHDASDVKGPRTASFESLIFRGGRRAGGAVNGGAQGCDEGVGEALSDLVEDVEGVMLDELCELTGRHRDYATGVAHGGGHPGPAKFRPVAARRTRASIYGDAVVAALVGVWMVMDFACGKRLAAFNKAQRWVIEPIDNIATVLPFALLGLDSGNGLEFINRFLFEYGEAHQITFIRGRPYRKNDSWNVEQKNWCPSSGISTSASGS